MIGGLQNIPKIPELKKKILFTLMMLAVYRVGCHIPTPGIDGAALSAFFSSKQGTLFGLFDMFSGGALSQMSVMALGIMPYISASIILELMTVVVPYLEKLKKEGEQGRKKITQYTRYGTVILSVIQGFGIAVGLENMSSPGGVMVVPVGGWGFRILTVITLTAGTSFLMWLGEQITERGIGNGISLIIFAGIVARGPSAIVNSIQLIKAGEIALFFVPFLVLFMFFIVAVIVFFETAQRRITIQ
jgi:preprotein translocase subunit SecY